jgi:hypothetical protein
VSVELGCGCGFIFAPSAITSPNGATEGRALINLNGPGLLVLYHPRNT